MAREPSILESTAARPITRMMLWFTNLRTSPTQYLGLRYDEDDGRPTLRLLHPNGAQVTKPFSTHAARVLCAMRLQDELLRRGWWLSGELLDTDAPES